MPRSKNSIFKCIYLTVSVSQILHHEFVWEMWFLCQFLQFSQPSGLLTPQKRNTCFDGPHFSRLPTLTLLAWAVCFQTLSHTLTSPKLTTTNYSKRKQWWKMSIILSTSAYRIMSESFCISALSLVDNHLDVSKITKRLSWRVSFSCFTLLYNFLCTRDCSVHQKPFYVIKAE